MYVEDTQRALRVMGPRFVQIYGQAESPTTITALARHHLLDTAHPRHLQRLTFANDRPFASRVCLRRA
jgi:long-chain acyl-CoA synthetase